MKKGDPINMSGSCRLCLEKKELVKSHIISNFLFKPLYDEKPQYNELSTAGSARSKKGQGGITERLLCSKCEQRRAVWEQYARKFLFGGIDRLDAEKVTANSYNVKGLNYSKLKLFFLSTVWMASISTDPKFNLIDLGPHEERIREKLKSEDPGPYYTYPLIIFGMSDDWAEGMLQWSMIRIEGHNSYRFVMGGAIWVLVVSSHKLPPDILKLSLKENGEVLYNIRPVKKIDFLVQAASDLKANMMFDEV